MTQICCKALKETLGRLDESLREAIELESRQWGDVNVLPLRDVNFDVVLRKESLA